MSDTQAQAEDRRAQIEALMDRTLSVFKEDDNELEEAIEALLDDLARLSRVEQALREALHQQIMNIRAWPIAAHVTEMSPLEAYRLGHKDARHDAAEIALSASPEAQPEEGR